MIKEPKNNINCNYADTHLFRPIAKILRIWDFDKLFIHLLHLTLHYFDQRCKLEVHFDVTLYLHPASVGGTEIYDIGNNELAIGEIYM